MDHGLDRTGQFGQRNSQVPGDLLQAGDQPDRGIGRRGQHLVHPRIGARLHDQEIRERAADVDADSQFHDSASASWSFRLTATPS
jgi:hypothetical protein